MSCSNNEPVSTGDTKRNDITALDNVHPKTDRVEDAAVENSNNEVTHVTRSADRHTHGDAELAVVLENQRVTIELDTPLYNVLGFEQAPMTDAQKASVKHAQTRLGRGAELFTFNRQADCKITTPDQSVRLFATDDHDDHDDDHEGDHEGDHDDHEDEHEDEAAHNDHDEDTHRDVFLRYTFICKDVSALSNMSINLFDFFDELSEIGVTYLGPSSQTQLMLSRNKTKMDIIQ